MKIFSSNLLCACCSVAAVTVTQPTAAAALPPSIINDAATCASIVDRVDCSSGVGSPNSDYNMTREFCEGRGCCFDDNSSGGGSGSGDQATPCFFPSEGVDVEVVHMINSNHFDAGYADLTVAVVNEYFDKYFPLAAKTGATLRKEQPGVAGAGPLKWMTFSWMISLFFDCPEGYGLHCPDSDAQAIVEDAIRAQDIVWAAFPHNGELATVDASYLSFGVDLSQSLARRFNVSEPQVVSTRDVPGMPRSALPILEKAGVIALSEGMNGRMVPVNVPPAFQWQNIDATNSTTVMPTLWHWHGYGELGEPGDPIRIPGSKHALAYCWRGDNAGPPRTAIEVLANAAALKKQFSTANPEAWIFRAGLVRPNRTGERLVQSHAFGRRFRTDGTTPHAHYGLHGENVAVISSTFDEYVKAVMEEGAFSNLPVITQDLSDSWIWGVSSDPVKTQRARAIVRARSECEKAGDLDCSSSDASYANFSRLALKNSEHTWGVSVGHLGNLADAGWSNTDFHNDLANDNKILKFLASSWVEQRLHGWDFPLSALPQNHSLRTQLETDMAAVQVGPQGPDPSSAGFSKLSNFSAPLANLGQWAFVEVDPSGALRTLRKSDGASIATPQNLVAKVQYQTLDLDDYEAWQSQYLLPGSGGLNEYGKPPSAMNATPTPTHSMSPPSVQSAWINSAHDQVWVETMFDSSLVRDYGAAAAVWLLYNFSDVGILKVDVVFVNKTATRLGEATYVTFNPVLGQNASWSHSVLGQWSDPNDIADGAAHGLHYVDDAGVRLQSSTKSAVIRSPDVGLLRYSEPLPFPTPLTAIALGDLEANGASFCVHNNIWSTNYPMWYPFEGAKDASLRVRFEVDFN